MKHAMKYDKRVHEAIWKSVEKWIGIAYEGEADINCVLCDIFKDDCKPCPIEITGFGCLNLHLDSPWREWCNSIRGRNLPERVIHDKWSKQAAINMMDYLIHLYYWYDLTAERG